MSSLSNSELVQELNRLFAEEVEAALRRAPIALVVVSAPGGKSSRICESTSSSSSSSQSSSTSS